MDPRYGNKKKMRLSAPRKINNLKLYHRNKRKQKQSDVPMIKKETALQRNTRYAKVRMKRLGKLAQETDEMRENRLSKRRSVTALRRENETGEESAERLLMDRIQKREFRKKKLQEQHLDGHSNQDLDPYINESSNKKINVNNLCLNVENSFDTNCERNCDICTKKCSSNEVMRYKSISSTSTYRPRELTICSQCYQRSQRKCQSRMKQFFIPEDLSCFLSQHQQFIFGLNAVGNNETNRKCYDMTANPVLDPTETAKIENQHVPIEMIHCNIKTEVEVDEDIFTTAGVNIKQEENWENMDTNCLEPWKVSGTSGDRKRSEIVQIIKDEPGWESNMDSALVDPLQIDEIHESDAIVKFEKVALPQLEAVPTPKIN